MEWNDVRVLLALLEGKSVAAAGSRLGIDRTTTSRRLAALEKSLGAKLFTRTREGLRPTAAAERLRPHAEAMSAQATALAHAAKASEKASGVVRIATTEAMGVHLVREGLLGLPREILVEIVGGNRPVDLARGEADIALRISKVTEASLRVRCIARMPIGLFASPSYLGARGRPRSVAGLAGHDVVVPCAELTALPEAKWLARTKTHVTFRSNSMASLVTAAVAGLGIVALTLPWGDGDAGLERVMVLDDVPKRPVWLVSSAEASVRPEVQLVASRIAAIYARA